MNEWVTLREKLIKIEPMRYILQMRTKLRISFKMKMQKNRSQISQIKHNLNSYISNQVLQLSKLKGTEILSILFRSKEGIFNKKMVGATADYIVGMVRDVMSWRKFSSQSFRYETPNEPSSPANCTIWCQNVCHSQGYLKAFFSVKKSNNWFFWKQLKPKELSE